MVMTYHITHQWKNNSALRKKSIFQNNGPLEQSRQKSDVYLSRKATTIIFSQCF